MGGIHKLLYKWGFTGYGVRLLSELDPGTPEWFDFVEALFQGNDLDTRSLAVDQLKEEGFYANTPEKERVKNLALAFLKDGKGGEKRTAIEFFRVNQGFFNKEITDVFTAVYTASRNPDKQLATRADEILAAWGFDRDAIKSDKELR